MLTSPSAALGGALLGLALGARHALEPDHLVAVGVLTTEGASPRRALGVGALWGLGHSLTLLVISALLTSLATTMPTALSSTLELGVAAMLVALGVRALVKPAASSPHQPVGRPLPFGSLGRAPSSFRPVAIGALHGAAGSGALMAIALSRHASMSAALSFIAVFGLGSTLAMSAVSGLAGWPMARLASDERRQLLLARGAGALSIACGLLWGCHAAMQTGG